MPDDEPTSHLKLTIPYWSMTINEQLYISFFKLIQGTILELLSVNLVEWLQARSWCQSSSLEYWLIQVCKDSSNDDVMVVERSTSDLPLDTRN